MVSVVVPATDRPASLARCLEALVASDEGPEETIVVAEPAGTGPAAARNRGAAEATGEVICFVDSDVAVAPEAIGRVRAAFAADPGLAAVFGAYDYSPAAAGLVSAFRNLLHASVHRESAGRVGSFWAGLGAIRAEPLDAVGGFDAELFPRPSVEDVELGARLHAAGLRIELDPGISGKHLKRWTPASMIRADVRDRALPWTRLALAGRGPRTGLNLAPRRLLAASLSCALPPLLLAGRRRLAFAALGLIAAAERPHLAALHRGGGLPLTLAGLPLLVLHHLSAAAGAAAGLAAHLVRPLPRAKERSR